MKKWQFWLARTVLAIAIFLQTGRIMPADDPPTKSITPIQITQQTQILRGEGDAVVSFSVEDMAFVEVYNHSINQPDIVQLLTAPLELDLKLFYIFLGIIQYFLLCHIHQETTAQLIKKPQAFYMLQTANHFTGDP